MSLVINTNTASMSAQRQIMRSGEELDRATTRLSSGKRINAAADDAAGLAISSRMTSQVRGLDQAIRNANDGISLIQVADGALNETTNMLQRIRELSIQSSNGIYSDSDRATLNAEVKQLVSQIDFIAKNTEFNGQKILNGQVGKIDLQVGAAANQVVQLDVPSVDTKSLGLSTSNGDVVGAQMSINTNGGIIGGIPPVGIKINGKALAGIADGATVNTLLDKINQLDADVSASAVIEFKAETRGNGILQGSQTLEINAVRLDGSKQAYTISNTTSLDEMIAEINEAAGSVLIAGKDDNGTLTLTSTTLATLTVLDGAGGAASGVGVGSNPNPDITKVVSALENYWIAEAENLISTWFGMVGDSVSLTLNLDDTDGQSNNIASVSWTSSGGLGNNLKLNIDMADFTPANLPNGNAVGGWLYSDRVITHELVHAVMTRNMNMSALPGWFTEGAAEFIHGADERVEADVAQANLTADNFDDIFVTASAGGSPTAVGYSVGYVAVKMLHQDILATAGVNSGGIKLLFDELQSNINMTLDQAIINLKTANKTTYTGLTTGVNDFEDAAKTGGFAFIGTNLNFDTGAELDTGSISGSDYLTTTGTSAKTAQNVLSNAPVGGAINFDLIVPDKYGPGAASVDAQLVLTSKSGGAISIAKGSVGSDANLNTLGLREMSQSNVLGGELQADGQNAAIAINDVKINGVSVGAVAQGQGLSAKVAAINTLSDETGVLASVQAEVARSFDLVSTKELVGTTTGYAVTANGAFSINGIGLGVTLGDTLSDVSATINAYHHLHGAYSYVDDAGAFHLYSESGLTLADDGVVNFFTAQNILADSGTSGSIKIKGVEVSLSDITDVKKIVTDLNIKQAETGVSASVDENGKLQLESASAFNIGLGNTKGMKSLNALGFSFGLEKTDLVTGDDYVFTNNKIEVSPRIQLTAKNGQSISVDVTSNGAFATGLLDLNSAEQVAGGASLNELTIATKSAAIKSIEVVDNALKSINDARSNLGAVNNRLDFTIANLTNVSEKTTAALSRIVDTDFAQETAKLSRSTVLQQAAQAMLAQANQRPNQVLSLLR